MKMKTKTYRLILTEEEHQFLKVEAAKAGKTIRDFIMDTMKKTSGGEEKK